jgi:hypothetical protein
VGSVVYSLTMCDVQLCVPYILYCSMKFLDIWLFKIKIKI